MVLYLSQGVMRSLNSDLIDMIVDEIDRHVLGDGEYLLVYNQCKVHLSKYDSEKLELLDLESTDTVVLIEIDDGQITIFLVEEAK